MTETIKIRAFNTKTRVMSKPCTIPELIADVNRSARLSGGGEVVVEGYVYMLYTGTNDKNGVEIYSGDIVALEGSTYPILWASFDDCCVAGESWVLKGLGYQQVLGYYSDAESGLEVVGNVHESPELLKEAA